MAQPRQQWDQSLPQEIQVKCDWSHIVADNVVEASLRPPPIEDKDVQLIDNLLTPEESEAIIAAAEIYGFGRTDYPKHYRGNLRLLAADKHLAEHLYERIRRCLPQCVSEDNMEWELVGLNELFRLSKYVPGDRFGAHVDTCFYRDRTEKSMYTLNIYLNDAFEGGSTRFLDRGNNVEATVIPYPGTCLLFRQPPFAAYRHDGEEVTAGFKYLLRSDAMYRVKEPV
jgi:prolyl 4-hydroxylase